MALTVNSGYKSLNLYFSEPQNTYFIDDINSQGTSQIPVNSARTDKDKLYVWIGTSSSFNTDTTTLVYEGNYQNNITIDKYYDSSSSTKKDLEDNTNYYIKYAITSKLEPLLQDINTVAIGATTRDIGSDVGFKDWVIINANYQALSGDRIIADTSAGSFTITLPGNPTIGTSVTITDGANFLTNKLTVARNGSTILTQQKDVDLDILNTTFEFIYTGSPKGWDFTATTGPKGDDATVIDLSNDNQDIATDTDGTNGDYSLAVTTLFLNTGTINALPFVKNLIITPSLGVEFNYTKNGVQSNNFTSQINVPITPAINTLILKINNLVGQDNGKLTITTNYGNSIYSIEFTISKNKGGAAAVIYSIEANSEIIYNPNTKIFSPSKVIYTAYSKTGNTTKIEYKDSTGKINLEYSTNNTTWIQIGSPQQLSSTISTRELDTTNPLVLPKSAKYLRYTFLINNIEVDKETDAIVNDGTNASVVTVDVENDNHTIPANSSGVISYQYSGTNIQVFDNVSELQYISGPSSALVAGQWTLTGVTGSNITPSVTVGYTADPFKKYLVVPDHSNLTGNTASITYTIKAITNYSVEVPGLQGNQTFSKVLSSPIYRITGATTIVRSKASLFSPITLSAQKIDGTTLENDFGFLTFTPSTGTESSKQKTPFTYTLTTGSSATSVLVKLYKNSNDTEVLDSSDIKIVSEGIDGTGFTVDVINDAHAIPCDSDGTPISYQYSGTDIYLFENTTELQYIGTSTPLNTGEWKIASVSGTNITPSTIPGPTANQKYATIADHSNLTSNNTASITYNIEAKTTKGVVVSGLKGNQTFTKLKLSAIFRIINATPIRVSSDGTIVQATINGQKTTAEKTVSPFGWVTEQLDNGSVSAVRQQLTSSGYTTTATLTTKQVTIRLYDAATGGNLVDTAELKVISDGVSVIVDVENDTHQIPFTASGTPTYTFSGTKIQVFENANELQYVSAISSNSQWTITNISATNITASAKPSYVSTQKYATVLDHSNLTSDTATITYTIQAKTSSGLVVNNLLGNQTFTKVQRSGVWRIVGAAAIGIDNNGTVNQVANITGQLIDGTTILQNQGWLTQQIMPGGTESSPRVQQLTTNATSSSKYVTIKLYDAVTGGNLIDQADLRVITSGGSGQSVDIVFTRIAAGSTPTITSNINPPSGNSTWSTSPPTGSNPLWASTGYSSSPPYTTWVWDTPVRITGETVIELSVYTRSSSSSITTPSGGSYNFISKTFTTLPTSSGVTWSDNVPVGTDPVWESRAVITDINTAPTWSTPVRISMSARALDISGIASIKYDNSSATKFNPSSLSLSAVTSNLIGTVSYNWLISPNTGITVSGNTTSNATFTFSNSANKDTKTITLQATDSIGTLSKSLTIPIIENAENTVDISYSNDSHGVSIGSSGAIWTGSGGIIEVFEGQIKLTLNTTSYTASYPSANGRYNLSITKISGDTLTLGNISGSTTVTLSQWSGTITQPTVYRISAYVLTSGGTQVVVSTDATLTPAKDGVSYSIITNSSAITRDLNTGIYTPSTLTTTLYRRVGDSGPQLYPGRFIINLNNSASALYTSSVDESSVSIPLVTGNNITSVRFRAYLAGGTSTLIDEETINVVNSGLNGAPGAPGAPAKGIDINATVTAFKKSGGSYNPASSILTAVPQNLTSPSYNWTISGQGSLNTTSGSTVTVTPTGTTYITVTLTATDTGSTYQKSITLSIYSDGIGQDGKRTATGYVYYQQPQSTAPSKPTAANYQFTTGTFSSLSSNWSTSAPTYTPNNVYWAATYTALEDSASSNSSSGSNLSFSNPQQTIGFSGLVTFSSLATPGQTIIDGSNITTGEINATRINTNGLVIRNSLGVPILGIGYPLEWSNISSTYPNSIVNSGITIDGSGILQGIGTTSKVVANDKISLSASTGSLTLNTGAGSQTTNLSSAGINSMAYIQKLTKANLATYMDSGIIENAFIGNIISSTNFDGQFNENTGVISSDGTTGWAIGKAGKAVFNSLNVRGKLRGGTTTNQIVEVGANVGSTSGSNGITLSETNDNNCFLRRSDGSIVFNINSGGSQSLTFSTANNQLNITGNITCNTLTANNLITTNMIKQNQVSNIIIASYTGTKGIIWYNDNTQYGYLWPFNTRGIAVGPAVITPESGSKILINWSTQYYSARYEYNLIEIWRFIDYGTYWVPQRLYYLGSQADITNQAAQGPAFRIQGEEVASGAFVDTTTVAGKITAYHLVAGNNAESFTYVMNPYLSLTELKR